MQSINFLKSEEKSIWIFTLCDIDHLMGFTVKERKKAIELPVNSVAGIFTEQVKKSVSDASLEDQFSSKLIRRYVF